MASKLFISAKEVAKELEVSDSYAYRLIRRSVERGNICYKERECSFVKCGI